MRIRSTVRRNSGVDETGGRLTHFVSGLGTSGTFVGTGRRLRRERPDVRLISVQPDGPLHGLEGLKHMASAIVPAIYDPSLADANVAISTDEAYRLVRRLARESGVLAGPSSGAALAAAIGAARAIDRGVIVAIFPDGGDRYLSERFWHEPDAAADRADRPDPLLVPDDVRDAMRSHAAGAYPDECCGALIASARGTVVDAVPLDNSSSEPRQRRFLVGPDGYRRAEARAAATGDELAGFYHSHPDHPAVPSTTDLAQAWPNLSYVILSVRAGRAEALRSWRLRPDRTGFDEQPVHSPGRSAWP